MSHIAFYICQKTNEISLKNIDTRHTIFRCYLVLPPEDSLIVPRIISEDGDASNSLSAESCEKILVGCKVEIVEAVGERVSA